MGIKSNIKSWFAVKIRNLLDFECKPTLIMPTYQLKVGRDSFHNGRFEVRGIRSLSIGSFCAFGKDIKLITSNHNYNYPVLQYSFYKRYFGKKPDVSNRQNQQLSIEIGSDVWIGDNVCILPDVKIGHGAIIGTGSVVTKDVADYSIHAGVPAKFIKKRFSDEDIERLLEMKWWEWSDEEIIKNKDFFFKNLNDCE